MGRLNRPFHRGRYDVPDKDPFDHGTVALAGQATRRGKVWAAYGDAGLVATSGAVAYVLSTDARNGQMVVYVGSRDVDLTVGGYTHGATTSDQYGALACFVDSDTYIRATVRGDGRLLLQKVDTGATTLTFGDGFSAGDTTPRDVRLEVAWPTLNVYYDGASSPDLTHTLSAGDQAIYSASRSHGFYLRQGAHASNKTVVTNWAIEAI